MFLRTPTSNTHTHTGLHVHTGPHQQAHMHAMNQHKFNENYQIITWWRPKCSFRKTEWWEGFFCGSDGIHFCLQRRETLFGIRSDSPLIVGFAENFMWTKTLPTETVYRSVVENLIRWPKCVQHLYCLNFWISFPFLSALISKYSTSSRCVYFFFVSSVTLCVELSLRSFIFFLCVMKCVLLSMKMVCVYTDVSRTHTRTHLPNTKYVIRQCRTILVYGIGHLSMHVTVCVSILSECFFLLSSECRARCNLIGSKVKAEFSSDINYNVCE